MSFKAVSVFLVLAVALIAASAVARPSSENPDPRTNSTVRIASRAGFQRYFIFNDKQLNFFGAWHECRSLGLRLATIRSVHDDQILRIAFAKNNFNQWVSWWIAGTDLGKTGSYEWITDKTPIYYENFLQGQPDNYKGVEHCLEVGSGGIGTTQWNDRNCEHKLRYICELDTCDW